MDFDRRRLTRRRFVRNVAVGLPAGAIFGTAKAQDMPRLTEDDPMAQALKYVHDAADVDTSDPLAARYEQGQTCVNCAQIQGEEGAEWRPCAIFPGKLVNANGWCSVWAAKPPA